MVDAVLTQIARVRAQPLRVAAYSFGFDTALLYAVGLMGLLGIVLSFAAGPVATARIGIASPFHFTERHAIFLGLSAIVLITTALLDRTTARRAGLVTAGVSLLLVVAAILFGPEIKGAKRWLPFGAFSLQPSEFLKPGFVIAAAWFLSADKDEGFPGAQAAFGLYGIASALLLLQPDYGQWVLLTGIWGIMFFVAGWSWAWTAGLGTAAGGLLFLGYTTQAHVRARIDRFLDPSSGDAYQTQKAAEAISSGGFLGHDMAELPGVKQSLPDAHTDFVFAVAVEEFGLLMGVLIISLFAVLALRGFRAALAARSVFQRTAVAGLTAALTLQAGINIGVNLGVLPAKGMTLPFISYGGSSLLAASFTAGLLLALTRRGRA